MDEALHAYVPMIEGHSTYSQVRELGYRACLNAARQRYSDMRGMRVVVTGVKYLDEAPQEVREQLPDMADLKWAHVTAELVGAKE